MNIRKILPSKKFVKIVGGIGFIILAIFLIKTFAGKKVFYKSASKGHVLVVGDAVEKDTDGDGLHDWEEGLWGTDPNNPDTDGNGVSDGQQIRALQASLSGISIGENSLATDTTKTGALTRDILTIAKAVNQSGPLTPESQEAITDEIANYLAKRDQMVFTIKDITIMESATQTQARNYATLMKKSVEGTTLNNTDVALISEYEANIDSGNMAPYFATGDKFTKEREFIRKTAVPEQYITIHLAYINALEGLGSLYTDIGSQEEDPAKALAAVISAQAIFDQYQKALELMQE